MAKTVFCFGSNEAGIHGAGAALTAYKKHGAIYGKSYGHYGDSFAIPTKNGDIETLDLKTISLYVQGFLAYAKGHPKLKFKVTRIGCGLAGLKDEDIAPMFRMGTKNLHFDDAWKPWLEQYGFEFWGAYP